MGGDIRFVKCREGIRTPDYIWNGKMWELKSPETAYGAKSAIHSAEGQINKNPGGIIINFKDHDVDINEAIAIADERITQFRFETKLIIIHKNEIVNVRQYKK